MPKSSATKEARGWLSTGRAPESRSLEVALSLALLSGEVPLIPAVFEGREIKRDVLMALVLEAEARSMFKLVELLKDHVADKETRKVAKKVLFRARQRGLLEKKPEPLRVGVKLATAQDAPPSFCSSFDGTGTQVAVWGGVDERDGSFALLGILSVTRGLESVSYIARPSLTRMRTLCDDLRGRFRGEVAKVDESLASGRLRWGFEIAAAAEAFIDGDTGLCRRLLRDVSPVDATNIDVPECPDTDLVDGPRLLEHRCFESWLVEDVFTIRKKSEDALLDIEFDGDETDERVHNAIRDAVSGHFAPEYRRSLADRLLLTVPILRVVQPDLIATVAATARSFADADTDALTIPFLRAALGKAVDPADLVGRIGEK